MDGGRKQNGNARQSSREPEPDDPRHASGVLLQARRVDPVAGAGDPLVDADPRHQLAGLLAGRVCRQVGPEIRQLLSEWLLAGAPSMNLSAFRLRRFHADAAREAAGKARDISESAIAPYLGSVPISKEYFRCPSDDWANHQLNDASEPYTR